MGILRLVEKVKIVTYVQLKRTIQKKADPHAVQLSNEKARQRGNKSNTTLFKEKN